MKQFAEIDGYLIALDAIEIINPENDQKKGQALIRFKSGHTHYFPIEIVKKLRQVLSPDTQF